MNITTVGVDLAKDIITVHVQNAQGAVYIMAQACMTLLNKADYGNAVCSCNSASRYAVIVR